MNRKCPRCKGSGNVGVISTLRCNSCSGEGKLRVKTTDEEKRYRDLVVKFGWPEGEPKTDDRLLGDDDTWDESFDGLDDTAVAGLAGGGDYDDDYDDDYGWGD